MVLRGALEAPPEFSPASCRHIIEFLSVRSINFEDIESTVAHNESIYEYN